MYLFMYFTKVFIIEIFILTIGKSASWRDQHIVVNFSGVVQATFTNTATKKATFLKGFMVSLWALWGRVTSRLCVCTAYGAKEAFIPGLLRNAERKLQEIV